MSFTLEDNGADVIDSRDIIARIEELEELEEHLASEDKLELATLRIFAKEASQYAEDWIYGEALIHRRYFVEYARQLAEDIGAIEPNAGEWPRRHIDWQAAADELEEDYTSVTLDGEEYLIR